MTSLSQKYGLEAGNLGRVDQAQNTGPNQVYEINVLAQQVFKELWEYGTTDNYSLDLFITANEREIWRNIRSQPRPVNKS